MSNKENSRKRQRFQPDDDLALLREVISQNPLKNTEKWVDVQKNLESITGKTFSIRTLKDHVYLMLESWNQKNLGLEKRSGKEKVYSERDILLQEMFSICNEFNIELKKKKNNVSKEKKIAQLGQIAREKCAIEIMEEPQVKHAMGDTCRTPQVEISTNFSDFAVEVEVCADHDYLPQEHDVTLTSTMCASYIEIDRTPKKPVESGPSKVLAPLRKRTNKSGTLRRSALDYLTSKEDRQREIRMKELDFEERRLNIEERKLKLDEERFVIEIKERILKFELEKDKLKLEIKEREQSMKIIETQQKILEKLLQQH